MNLSFLSVSLLASLVSPMVQAGCGGLKGEALAECDRSTMAMIRGAQNQREQQKKQKVIIKYGKNAKLQFNAYKFFSNRVSDDDANEICQRTKVDGEHNTYYPSEDKLFRIDHCLKGKIHGKLTYFGESVITEQEHHNGVLVPGSQKTTPVK